MGSSPLARNPIQSKGSEHSFKQVEGISAGAGPRDKESEHSVSTHLLGFSVVGVFGPWTTQPKLELGFG